MSWYIQDKYCNLNYSEPIFATHYSVSGHEHILLPNVDGGIDNVLGYDWFNLLTGTYTTCQNFQTVGTAILHVTNSGFRVFNGVISIINNKEE